MKRKHKLYSRPKRPFDKARIDEEAIIIEKFGLKSKTEIWKADAKVKLIRQKAKNLITASQEEQQAFFARLKKIGFNVKSIADVLSLTKEDYLQRRLQSVVVAKKILPTMKAARQAITHRKIIVNTNVTDSPSYIVPVEFENKISLKQKTKKAIKLEKPVESKETEAAEESEE